MELLFHILLLLFIDASCSESRLPSSYRAAVYEHVVEKAPFGQILSRAQALAFANRNLAVFRTQARIAAQRGAQIIVFPEDGIHGTGLSRDGVRPFLEYVPDPQHVNWVPCDEPTRFSPSDILQTLSCIAKCNKIYLVANMGDLQPCDKNSDKNCTDGRYQYNTDVAFDPSGQLIARYHKINLYYEFQFDAGKPEAITFKTPFGEFGVVTCFDFLFGNPIVSLVKEKGIGNIVGPTAWMDVLPLLAAIEFHSSFAMGLGINFLTANLHHPEGRFQGSGIWTPTGPSAYYYSRTPGKGKLLIADVNTVAKSNLVPISVFQNKVISLQQHMLTFNSKLWHDEYTFVPLQKPSGQLSVCSNGLCCSLNYSMIPNNNDLYAFGAFDGRHAYRGNQYYNYLQVCTLVRCANSSRSSCGSDTRVAGTIFNHVEITGTFSTSFVYPEMLLADNSTLKIAEGRTTYKDGVFSTLRTLPYPLLTATMYGRLFERDDPSSDLVG